jgi:hypothetical protein
MHRIRRDDRATYDVCAHAEVRVCLIAVLMPVSTIDGSACGSAIAPSTAVAVSIAAAAVVRSAHAPVVDPTL